MRIRVVKTVMNFLLDRINCLTQRERERERRWLKRKLGRN
jgi:hypothetical protein